MEGKTAEEREAADPTREVEAPGWFSRMGAGSIWTTVNDYMTKSRHGHGHGHGGHSHASHGHSHNGVPCDGGHGAAPPPVVNAGHGHGHGHGSRLTGSAAILSAAKEQGKSLKDRFILACVMNDSNALEEAKKIYAEAKSLDAEEQPEMKNNQMTENVGNCAATLMNDRDDLGYNATHHACYRGHFRTVEWLLQLPELDLTCRTTDTMHKLGASPLHLAVTTGSVKLVHMMMMMMMNVPMPSHAGAWKPDKAAGPNSDPRTTRPRKNAFLHN
eukprot:SAG11_NODE_4530_length_1862_cov_10.456041_1_plen_272_part_00